MSASQVVGVALHWPANVTPIRGFANVCTALRNWQAYHMGPQLGWSDIGYQVAIDQDGNRYDLRGFRTQSGANGGSTVNAHYCAILCIVAVGEKPTPELIQGVRDAIADMRTLYPKGLAIVGHSDIRPEPTACPGEAIRLRIDMGLFEPLNPPAKPKRPDYIRAAIDATKKARDKAVEAAEKATGPVQQQRAKGALEDVRAALRKYRKVKPR